VWAVGREVAYDADGKFKGVDLSRDVLRHFDASGKLIGSAVPLGTVGVIRSLSGYLAATQDRLGWYSPTDGVGSYVEFSPDMKVLDSYPTPPALGGHSITWGFALTPAGNAYVVIAYPVGERLAPVLYERSRSSRTWISVTGVPLSPKGVFPMLEGNDGESLIFMGPPDKSRLQVLDVSQAVSR
jgi:hypothetical protein